MRIQVLVFLLAGAGIAMAQEELTQSGTLYDDKSWPESPFQPDLTPGYVLIDGDIQIRLEQYEALLNGEVGADSAIGDVTFWAGNTVPFDFVISGDGAVSAANQTRAVNAMNAIAAVTGLTFRAALAGDSNRIRFQNSTYNNSPVGVQGGTQIINIASWNVEIIICHEIYHSLGFWHEQSRPDRDTYITINANNICGSSVSTACTAGAEVGQCCLCVNTSGTCISCAHNFNIQTASVGYGPYDFDSFMHYPPWAFSCNTLDTITVNPPWNAQWQSVIGQRNHFSYYDTITCRGLYPLVNDRWLDRAYGGTTRGTFDQPYNSGTLAGALAGVPSGGSLFIKYGDAYSAVGTYTTAVTIYAPNGAVTLGN